MIMVVVYFTFLCETLQTFCFPLQAFQGMDQIKKGFLSKGMFQRLFERFSFCVVLFIIVRCSLTSGAKVVTSLIKSPHWVNLSQHHAVTNGSKITTLYWTRVADSSPGFSLDILGTRKKNVRDNLYLFTMQLIRVGFSFVAFKTSAVLYFFSFTLHCSFVISDMVSTFHRQRSIYCSPNCHLRRMVLSTLKN